MNRCKDALARLLEGLGQGDRGAMDELFTLVYDELRVLAHRQRQRWRRDHTMNTTALVHEVYVKLVGQAHVDAGSRAHFRALAARAMRHVLCNHARGRETLKRGGGHAPVPLEAAIEQPAAAPGDDGSGDRLASLDAALAELEQTRPRAGRVVECRFFGGMTVDETAAALGTSARSVKRDWAMAQAWLHRALGPAE